MALTDTTLASPVPPASSRCPPAPSATSPSWESMLTGRVVGIALGAAGAAAAAVVVLFIYFKKNRRQPCSPCGSVPLGTGLCDFTPDQIRDFTNDFSEKNRLGGGAFGDVYYGVIPNGEEVAAKRLTVGGGQGDREFLAEIENLSRAHDKHVVSLVGYCSAGPERILVYKFVPNHTLAFHLRGGGLDWTARLKIAVGSAKGLQYLHDDCRPKIVHRDIKASNILLDSKFEAKISDFGLAKCISESRSHVTTVVKGTCGYIAPEYFSTGKLTEKSDIYSFGVVLLELITGRRPGGSTENSMGLVDWARPQFSRALEDEDFDSLVDSRLQNCYERNQMARMVACAAACVRRVVRDRPRMSKIVQVLEGNLPLSDLNDGIRCGLCIFCRCGGSLDNGTGQVLGKSKKIPLARQEYSSVGPSHQAPGDLELGNLDRDSQGFSGGS